MGESFTWFPKLTRTVERVPEGQRGLLLWALAQYGTNGIEPELDYPLDMAFEALRDDIDHSKNNRHNNKGGRPKKTTVEGDETTVKNPENPGLETNNHGSEGVEPNTVQNSTEQNNTKKGKGRRFTPPTVTEIREYCAGYVKDGRPHPLTIDAERFIDYYSAQGWKLSNGNTMKDWKAAVRNWARDSRPKGGGDEYTNL